MRIVYPYNEILPKKTAHDVYLFHECCALANEGADMHLLAGKGPQSLEDLYLHYNTKASLNGKFLPILRKNNPFNLSWNLPFFYFCQKTIESLKPDAVLLSVHKQAEYHLKRKIKNVLYIYEVHQLSSYPGEINKQLLEKEKALFASCDLILTTTTALQNLLKSPPYQLKTRVLTIPLAVTAEKLLPVESKTPFTFCYVGQLYQEQGILKLLQAFSAIENAELKIIGGKREEIEHFSTICKKWGIEKRVHFLGFIPPSALNASLNQIHAFVAPFEKSGRMPYVAHTKLYEYYEWGRPFIAPALPLVTNEFSENQGIHFFEPDSAESLSQAMKTVISNYPSFEKPASLRKNSYSWTSRAQAILQVVKTL